MNRADRRRAAFAMAKDALLINKAQAVASPPKVQVTIADIQAVLAANPFFRQELVNAAVRREAAETKGQEVVTDCPPSITVEDQMPLVRLVPSEA